MYIFTTFYLYPWWLGVGPWERVEGGKFDVSGVGAKILGSSTNDFMFNQSDRSYFHRFQNYLSMGRWHIRINVLHNFNVSVGFVKRRWSDVRQGDRHYLD